MKEEMLANERKPWQQSKPSTEILEILDVMSTVISRICGQYRRGGATHGLCGDLLLQQADGAGGQGGPRQPQPRLQEPGNCVVITFCVEL